MGDRWRIRAYPVNEIVEVSEVGTFSEKVFATRQNLIHAINRARNDGKLAMRAYDPTEGGSYDSSVPRMN